MRAVWSTQHYTDFTLAFFVSFQFWSGLNIYKKSFVCRCGILSVLYEIWAAKLYVTSGQRKKILGISRLTTVADNATFSVNRGGGFTCLKLFVRTGLVTFFPLKYLLDTKLMRDWQVNVAGRCIESV